MKLSIMRGPPPKAATGGSSPSRTIIELESYTVSLFVKNNTTITGSFYLRKRDNINAVYIGITASMSSRISASFTLNDDTDLRIVVSGSSSGYNFDISQVQIELGTTATAYEPYTAETHTHNYSSTVYGGVDDFVSGEGSSKFAIKTLTGAEGINWTLSGTQTLYIDTALLPDVRVGTSRIYGVCSACPSIKASTGEMYINNAYMDKPSSSSRGIEFKQVVDYWGLEEATSTALNAKLAELYANGTPVQICYELATATPITNTPEDISLLKGVNVVSTDGDSLELKYSADIKAYIDSKLAQMLPTLMS